MSTPQKNTNVWAFNLLFVFIHARYHEKNRFIEYINLLHSTVIKKEKEKAQFQSLYSQALSGFKYPS